MSYFLVLYYGVPYSGVPILVPLKQPSQAGAPEARLGPDRPQDPGAAAKLKCGASVASWGVMYVNIDIHKHTHINTYIIENNVST